MSDHRSAPISSGKENDNFTSGDSQTASGTLCAMVLAIAAAIELGEEGMQPFQDNLGISCGGATDQMPRLRQQGR